MNVIEEAAKQLVPPGIDRTLAWRLTVSASIAFLLTAFLWSVGVFAGIGYPGFARADKLDAVLIELQEQKVVRLETELRELQRSYCTATDNRSSDYWERERDRRRSEYFNLTRREYPLPGCDQIATTK